MKGALAVLFATTNPHKIKELRGIFEPLGIFVRSLDSLSAIPPEPEEDADTFAGNARLKAVAYARATGIPCLAEDSGLEVDALGGVPGVHSARYSGTSGTRDERDRANNEKLLAALAGVPEARRTARFVCAMCVASPDGRVLAESTGTYEGIIADAPRGVNGFGYDPLLYLPDVGRTSAELTEKEKSERSHRGNAARLLAKELLSRGAALQALLASLPAPAKVPAS
ncbi:MAG TPA: RdgB/HAM1 family non-canonical purine NTP pyrophosphatase [Polyangiaceae bacterium]|jgi:XTP/dITP diphosphohydrolase|nr:RdgB/HAM1 family non-canonical purine NTP pyrophosphatase [Polyangiaceae bacterium]